MLAFKNVSVSIGKNKVLQNINFEVLPGELVALIGESGAGKSTLFKLLIGQLSPTLGQITLDEMSLDLLSFSSLQQYRRQIGIIFQDFRLLPQKTVFENVSFALEICGKEDGIDKKVPELLKMVDLWKKKNDFPDILSGGERQRLAIARALVHDPKILIADEATGNLDPKNSREISDIFKMLHEEKEMTILFATHDPVLIERLNPRVIRLAAHQVLFDEKNCSCEKAFEGIC